LIKPSHIRVYHFKPEVQIMIRALGKALLSLIPSISLNLPFTITIRSRTFYE
jgi:hypothetical protein